MNETCNLYEIYKELMSQKCISDYFQFDIVLYDNDVHPFSMAIKVSFERFILCCSLAT